MNTRGARRKQASDTLLLIVVLVDDDLDTLFIIALHTVYIPPTKAMLNFVYLSFILTHVQLSRLSSYRFYIFLDLSSKQSLFIYVLT